MSATFYEIIPVPAPRQTRSDAWRERACVKRYRAFKDKVAELGIQIPEAGGHIIFHLPMPKSWTQKKKDAMRGQPHKQTPDKDNLEKALLDAIYKNDSFIWDSRVTKLWADTGRIEIRLTEETA